MGRTGTACALRRGCAVLFLSLGFGAAGCASPFDWFQDRPSPAETAALGENDYERGKQYLAQGRFGLAVLHFRAALAETPDSIAALNGIGVTFDRMGRFDLATRAYGRALVLDPHDGQTLNNLGYSYLLQGRYELAVAYLRRASVTLEADARILSNRRLAEHARARAGGPPATTGRAGEDSAAPDVPFTPHLVRSGKGLRRLVTQPPEGAQESARGPKAGAGTGPGKPAGPKRHEDLLPGFLAAPMALGGPMTDGRALGSNAAPWPGSPEDRLAMSR